MKHVKLFESFFTDEYKKLSADFKKSLNKLKKDFKREVNEIFINFTDELTQECEVTFSDVSDDDFFANIIVPTFEEKDLESILQALDLVCKISGTKNLQFSYFFIYQKKVKMRRNTNDTYFSSLQNESVDDFKKRKLNDMILMDHNYDSNRSLTILIKG